MGAMLQCPRCREAIASADCPACGAVFIALDGVICTSDRTDLIRELGPTCASRWIAANLDECREACDALASADPASLEWRERQLEGAFALAHYPDTATVRELASDLGENVATMRQLADWIEHHRHPVAWPARALDVGCGPGRFVCELAPRFAGGVTAFDLRPGVLRLLRRLVMDGHAALPWRRLGREFQPLFVQAPAVPAGAVRLVQGNLLRSPFVPGRFDVVSALLLIDILPDAVAGLTALDRLVAPGGLLLVASPWHWDTDATPPARWWADPERSLREHLRAVGYTIVEDGDLPWAIPSHTRLVHRYRLQAVLARKGVLH